MLAGEIIREYPLRSPAARRYRRGLASWRGRYPHRRHAPAQTRKRATFWPPRAPNTDARGASGNRSALRDLTKDIRETRRIADSVSGGAPTKKGRFLRPPRKTRPALDVDHVSPRRLKKTGLATACAGRSREIATGGETFSASRGSLRQRRGRATSVLLFGTRRFPDLEKGASPIRRGAPIIRVCAARTLRAGRGEGGNLKRLNHDKFGICRVSRAFIGHKLGCAQARRRWVGWRGSL